MEKTFINSSQIDKVEYNPETQELDITFKRGVQYRYYQVPPEIWDEVQTTASITSLFYQKIKNHFKYQRLN